LKEGTVKGMNVPSKKSFLIELSKRYLGLEEKESVRKKNEEQGRGLSKIGGTLERLSSEFSTAKKQQAKKMAGSGGGDKTIVRGWVSSFVWKLYLFQRMEENEKKEKRGELWGVRDEEAKSSRPHPTTHAWLNKKETKNIKEFKKGTAARGVT